MKLESQKRLNIQNTDIELLLEPLNFCNKRKQAIKLSINYPHFSYVEIGKICDLSEFRVRSCIEKFNEHTRYYEHLLSESNSTDTFKKLNIASLWLGYDSETRLALEGVIIYNSNIAKAAMISGINYQTLHTKITKTKKLIGHFDRIVNSLTAFATTAP